MGCPKITLQINKTFGTDIDKDVVRRILAKHYKPSPDDNGNGVGRAVLAYFHRPYEG